MAYHTPKIPQEKILEEINKYFVYDYDTNELIRFYKNNFNFRVVGSDTGTAIITSILKRNCFVHHVVWYLHHKEWPKRLIDHHDQNYKNNNPTNLKESNCSFNQYNKPKKNGLPIGVHFRKDRKYNNYQAQIAISGKKLHLGFYDTPEEANIAYRMKYREFYGVEYDV